MRFDLNSRPDDIVLNLPDGDTITLQHELLTATERAAVLEMIDDSLSASMAYLFDKVLAWSGVTDTNGKPIPLHYLGEGGKTLSNIDKVFARLGFDIHVEAWLKQLVMNGVSFDKLMGIAKASLSERQIESCREVADRVGKTQAPSEGASSTS